MNNKLTLLLILVSVISGCKQEIDLKSSAFTAVNPLSYTDVVYVSNKDTVLIATFDGRISERINGKEKENLIINLSDEIYSLTFDAKNQRIYASTLSSGIVIIDYKKKKVLNHILLKETWIANLMLSKDGNVLAGRSSNRKNYIWNLKNGTTQLQIPDSLSDHKIMGISNLGSIILKSKGSYIFWNPLNNSIEKEVKINGELAAIDSNSNMLLISHNNFQYYNASFDSISSKKQHADWPYYVKEQDTTLRIPLQLALTVGQLTDKYIFTAGIDRSIRKWDKTSGDHLEDILKHKATISAVDISPYGTQLVSIDLKGGIFFHELQ
jgi:WD40 repeat protein